MAIGSVEPMHECSLEHLCMGTVRLKKDKKMKTECRKE